MSTLHISIFFFLSIFLSPSSPGFLAPITKNHDHSTPYYTLSVYLKTPPQPTKLLLDLGATFTSIDCTHNYTSATSHSVPCNSSLCFSLQSPGLCTSNCVDSPLPDCTTNNSCPLLPQNSFTKKQTAVALVDSLALPTTDGRNPGQLGVVSEFLFSCSDTTSLLRGHAAKEVTGLAGLGFSKFSLPAQVRAAFFNLDLFALCLSGSPSAPGVAFFEHAGQYYFLPDVDLSKFLNYTQLLSYSTGRSTVQNYDQRSDEEYYIGVTSIKINGKFVRFNQTLLTVDQKGYGGTKISTVAPYTILETAIFKSFTEEFVNESAAMNLKVTKPVKPFSVCYQADDVSETRVGPTVPTIDLVMQNNDVFWRIHGYNSMVRIVTGDLDVWCLGFVDGGAKLSPSIVIGAHQMENNLLQFDLGSKRLGFSSSTLLHNTMCANFNFTNNTSLKVL